MNNKIIDTNQVFIVGQVTSPLHFNHKTTKGSFFKMEVSVKRRSGRADVIPVIVSDGLVDVSGCYLGQLACIRGQFHSQRHRVDGKSHLMLSVFASEIAFCTQGFDNYKDKDSNQIFLDGYICKEPIIRNTPRGRRLAEVILAVNYHSGEADYLPCIFWERHLSFIENCIIGSHLQLHGRIQSREYVKKISESESETRIAYEVSANCLAVLE